MVVRLLWRLVQPVDPRLSTFGDNPEESQSRNANRDKGEPKSGCSIAWMS